MNGITTVDEDELINKRGKNRVPCLWYLFGGFLKGMSICIRCGFHKCEHERELV